MDSDNYVYLEFFSLFFLLPFEHCKCISFYQSHCGTECIKVAAFHLQLRPTAND